MGEAGRVGGGNGLPVEPGTWHLQDVGVGPRGRPGSLVAGHISHVAPGKLLNASEPQVAPFKQKIMVSWTSQGGLITPWQPGAWHTVGAHTRWLLSEPIWQRRPSLRPSCKITKGGLFMPILKVEKLRPLTPLSNTTQFSGELKTRTWPSDCRLTLQHSDQTKGLVASRAQGWGKVSVCPPNL